MPAQAIIVTVQPSLTDDPDTLISVPAGALTLTAGQTLSLHPLTGLPEGIIGFLIGTVAAPPPIPAP